MAIERGFELKRARYRGARFLAQCCCAGVVISLPASHAVAQRAGGGASQNEAPATADDAALQQSREESVKPPAGPPSAGDAISHDDDIAWLFSTADEYLPSSLGGDPIDAPALPSRREGSRRSWNPAWRRFSLGNYILTGVTLATGGAAFLIPPAPERWRTRNAVDEWGHDNLGTTGYQRSGWAQDTSDVLLSALIASPFLVDSLAVTYWYRESHDVAGQMALITAEAYGVASAIQGLTAGLASRERPYGRECGTAINDKLKDCTGNNRYRSFFSGHATLAFTAASVSCSHHLRHDVFGDRVADAVACASAFVTAAAVGTLRIVGDRHYISDVTVGAAFGTLSGFGIPWLLHYGPLARVSSDGKLKAMKLRLAAVPNGMGIGGDF